MGMVKKLRAQPVGIVIFKKSAYIHLKLMLDLQTKHPGGYKRFQDGVHVMRRSDRYWAGLPIDLAIEQFLMRSVKTSGGLIRGQGMTETQRLVWLMSMSSCAEVDDPMQHLTTSHGCDVSYQ